MSNIDLPIEVAEWVASVLPHRDAPSVQRGGLNRLKVPELKQLEQVIRGDPSTFGSKQPERLPARAKKQQRVEFVRRTFFVDPACRIVDAPLLTRLSSLALSSPPSVAAAETAVAVGGANDDRLAASSAAKEEERPAPASAAPRHRSRSPTKNATRPRIKIKKEPTPGPGRAAAAAPSDAQPQTLDEWRVLGELLQMGFSARDQLEILTAVRRLPPGSTSDAVVLAIVAQREEVSEARKMDEARLRSERTQHEQARREQGARDAATMLATSASDLRRVFPGSWLLLEAAAAGDVGRTGGGARARAAGERTLAALIDGAANDAAFMQGLKRLLRLEQRSLLWYGRELPSFYFERLKERFRAALHSSSPGGGGGGGGDAGTREALTFLEKECTALEAALYKLQEQEGGAPKVFLEEMREAKPQSDMMDGDDEVVVIGINRSSFKTLHASGGRHRGEATKNDVIEIDG